MIQMDESEESNEPSTVQWWELLDHTEAFIKFNYDEIQETGSDELKHAAEIVLGGHKPGGQKIKGESA